MKKLLVLIMLMSLRAMAQNNSIEFEKDLDWHQVRAKAQRENKYIFIDCYATWCGPCKQMDKEVYTNDTVGAFFNKNFVSVKLQMDETKYDTKDVKNWRKDTKDVTEQYKVLVYPTYIFLSPEGEVVHMEKGFKPPHDFLKIAHLATTPGKVYDNPYAEYNRLVADYIKGKKDYSKMPYLVKNALKFQEIELAKTVARDYTNYVMGLKDEDIYTKQNIDFFATVIGSKSKFFRLFFPDGRKVDSTINKTGYAENVVDQVILMEDIEPFIQMKAGDMQIMGKKLESRVEPNWGKLYQIISSKYTTEYAKRNVLDAKIIWYERQQNSIYTAYFVQRWEMYGLDTTDIKTDLRLNKVAWDIFLNVTDKEQISSAINWMQGVVKRSMSEHHSWKAATTDTYACLLYKVGNKKEAIQWEEKAIGYADSTEVEEFQGRIDQMKRDEQIWLSK